MALDLVMARFPWWGTDGGVELLCRQRGLGVIHGGKNALRFTPHFEITDDEVDLVIEELRAVFASLPVEGGFSHPAR